MAEATVLNPDLGFIKDVQALGGGRWDTSSLLVPLERMRRNTGD